MAYYLDVPSSSTTNLLPPRNRVHAGGSSRQSTPSTVSSNSSKYSFPASLNEWGSIPLDISVEEPDDELHNPDPIRDRKFDEGGTIFTVRGIVNLGCIFVLVVGIITLFAGYPLISHFTSRTQSTSGGFNLGGTNATGQVPDMPNMPTLIDRDTPKSAYTLPSFTNSGDPDLELVFSDEFNKDGRSFYSGDDPYWEAADLYYWQTGDMEYYDPQAITTQGGKLNITISQRDPVDNHNLSYMSGMLQSWNKFCFTGGIIVASVQLPGSPRIEGLWPALWTMGNLGRAGYGASLEGMWPYSYDSCDVGTLPNQTFPSPDNDEPLWALQDGDPAHNHQLSLLQGQRLSSCTCAGESHPGPARENGSYVGRSAPEIDVFEATVDGTTGQVSQSGQWGPFNAGYNISNFTSAGAETFTFYDPTISEMNAYKGGAVQQTTSGLTTTNQSCYELDPDGGCFAVYGYEYQTGNNGFITWVSNDKPTWTLQAAAMGPDVRTQIGQREIPYEPMYIMANLGFSKNFALISPDLTFPATMLIDYIRVYQPPGAKNIGCDPPDAPTLDYINTYSEAYTNPNLTTWGIVAPNTPGGGFGYNQTVPKNRLSATC